MLLNISASLTSTIHREDFHGLSLESPPIADDGNDADQGKDPAASEPGFLNRENGHIVTRRPVDLDVISFRRFLVVVVEQSPWESYFQSPSMVRGFGDAGLPVEYAAKIPPTPAGK